MPIAPISSRVEAGMERRRIAAVNARLLDNFEAADWPVTVIDGKHLW